MNLSSNENGYAVMTNNLSGISLDSKRIDDLIPYCYGDYVIAERIPKWVGFSISIRIYKYYKMICFHRYEEKNILWLHWYISKEYIHKTGKIVWPK